GARPAGRREGLLPVRGLDGRPRRRAGRSRPRRGPREDDRAGHGDPRAHGDTDRMPLILRLSELREEHAPLVGGKAASLGPLMAAGFSVPDGFVLTTEAFAGLDVSGDAQAVRKRIEQTPLALDVKRALAEAVRG